MDKKEHQEFAAMFGENFRKLRVSRALSQQAIAEILGYRSSTSRTAVAKIETGKRELPLSKVLVLCETFHVSADALLGLSCSHSGNVIPADVCSMLHDLDDEDLRKVVRYIKQLREQPKYTMAH